MVGCLEPKAWDARDAGWTERTRETVVLSGSPSDPSAVGVVASFRPYPMLDYRFVGCGDDGFADLDVLVYDADGALIARDGMLGRDPDVSVSGELSTRLTVRLFAADLRRTSGEAGVLVLAR